MQSAAAPGPRPGELELAAKTPARPVKLAKAENRRYKLAGSLCLRGVPRHRVNAPSFRMILIRFFAKAGKRSGLPRRAAESPGKQSSFREGANMQAKFHTSAGDFIVELFEDKVPKTVANFAGLANGTKEWVDPKTREKTTRPFYDGLIFIA